MLLDIADNLRNMVVAGSHLVDNLVEDNLPADSLEVADMLLVVALDSPLLVVEVGVACRPPLEVVVVEELVRYFLPVEVAEELEA